jgi:hypothetical protein
MSEYGMLPEEIERMISGLVEKLGEKSRQYGSDVKRKKVHNRLLEIAKEISKEPSPNATVTCPKCGTQLKRIKLAPHMKKCGEKRAPSAPKVSAKGKKVAAVRSKSQPSPKKKKTRRIYCEECERSFPSTEIRSHVCKPRVKSVYTISGGGGPGTGKKR